MATEPRAPLFPAPDPVQDGHPASKVVYTYLHEVGVARQTAITDGAGISVGGTSMAVAYLEESGLVETGTDPLDLNAKVVVPHFGPHSSDWDEFVEARIRGDVDVA